MSDAPSPSPRARARQATVRAVTVLVIGSFVASAPVGALFLLASADASFRPYLPPGAGAADDFILLFIGLWFSLFPGFALSLTLHARHTGDHLRLVSGSGLAMLSIGFFFLGSILGFLAYRRIRGSRDEWRRE